LFLGYFMELEGQCYDGDKIQSLGREGFVGNGVWGDYTAGRRALQGWWKKKSSVATLIIGGDGVKGFIGGLSSKEKGKREKTSTLSEGHVRYKGGSKQS